MQETKMEAPDAGNWRAGNPLAANPKKPRPRSASPPKPTPSESPRREKWKSSAVGGPEKRFSAELAAQPRLVVRVLGARGLGSSDVVARVWCARLDDVHDADAEPQETLPCRGGDAPAWETHNEFCFALKLDAPEDVQGGCCAVALRDDGVARETGYADGDAALGVAVVPLRMIFERGKAMAGTKTVHLTATWLPLGAAPNGARRARGEVLASFVFFFAEGLSRAAFETSRPRGARRRSLATCPWTCSWRPSRSCSRGRARAGRRSVANCFAAVLEGRPGPVPVWLDAAPASKHVGAAPPAAVLDDLRRRAASRGVALPVAATLLRDGTGAVLHCANDDGALDLRATLAQDEALPRAGRWTGPWRRGGAGHRGGGHGARARAFVLAARPRAPLASWVVESCKRHRDVLEPFCRAARALLQLRSDAQALGRADAVANAAFDPRLLASRRARVAEALDAAAPALARHARGRARSSWDRSSAPATARGTTASSTSATPRSGRSSRSKRCARGAATRSTRRRGRAAAASNALLGAKLPVSAVGLPRHDDAASVDYGLAPPATPPSPRRARPGGAPVPALDVSRLAEAPIPAPPARTLLYFAARAFSRSDVFPRPLLAWLAKDPRATCRAVRDDANQRVDLHHALRSLAVEPTQRGITASALLYALEDDSRRHEKVLVREAYAFGSDVEPPFP
ncbi:hypothetical protein SO694_000681105 [Aureococcus anophagefferens]|uniref:C2 domain-containing protein n=1 Tax=Aureococcus anophagefferens TaxID=44056 RepID=A0ABR1FPZ1_AURAN